MLGMSALPAIWTMYAQSLNKVRIDDEKAEELEKEMVEKLKSDTYRFEENNPIRGFLAKLASE
jgi:hypothetical protein